LILEQKAHLLNKKTAVDFPPSPEEAASKRNSKDMAGSPSKEKEPL
jgi:hypothetical protein